MTCYHHESLRDLLEVMCWQEVAQYRTCDYLAVDNDDNLSHYFPDFPDGLMGEQWRTRMCEWAYQCK